MAFPYLVVKTSKIISIGPNRMAPTSSPSPWQRRGDLLSSLFLAKETFGTASIKQVSCDLIFPRGARSPC